MKEKKEYVYEAIYNPMIYESAGMTISIHRTRRGAEDAIRKHKAEKRKEFDEDMKWRREDIKKTLTEELQREYLKQFKFSKFESWGIIKIEIQD